MERSFPCSPKPFKNSRRKSRNCAASCRAKPTRAKAMKASCDPIFEGTVMSEEGPGRDSGEAIRDGSANVAPPKQQYCPPVLVSHGRLQMFTAAEGGPVSAGHAIPSDKSDMRLKTRIEPLQDGALARVLSLHPVTFSRIEPVIGQPAFLRT